MALRVIGTGRADRRWSSNSVLCARIKHATFSIRMTRLTPKRARQCEGARSVVKHGQAPVSPAWIDGEAAPEGAVKSVAVPTHRWKCLSGATAFDLRCYRQHAR